MTDGLRPYPTYKDSGVPWLGDVPAHWRVQRQRNVVKMLVSNVDKLVVEGESPVRLCNYVDVYNHDTINERIRFMHATAKAEEINRFRLRIGDVIITKDSEAWNDIGVPALVNYEAEDLVCGYHLAILRPHAEILSGSYLLRALQSQGVAAQYHVEANGVTRFGLSQDAIKGVQLPLPPPDEQAAIVRYLDYVDRRIRRYIRAKRRLIDLLNEQKQAIIHQAVTRGLDPNVPLKPSGVEWLGDIPAHWETVRIKVLLRERDDRSEDGSETHLSMSQRHGLIPSAETNERRFLSESYAGGKLVSPGNLVLNRLKAHLGVFALAPQIGVISPDYSVFAPISEVNMRYCLSVLSTTTAF